MMELGSGIALGMACLSAGAVSITAIRTFGKPSSLDGKNGVNRVNGKNGSDATFRECPAHSGVVVGIANIEKTQERQDKWLNEISSDVKKLLQRSP
ncbi:MAG: hypothetical protein WC294_00065 [Methanoregula sp.]